MVTDKDQEKLESYILDNLSKREREIIENRLLIDSDLKEEYEYLLLLNKALLDKVDLEEKILFLKKLSSNKPIFIKYKRPFYIAATVLLVIGIGYTSYFNYNNEPTLNNEWSSPSETMRDSLDTNYINPEDTLETRDTLPN